ncbi:Alginate lyase [compost metagenome]
MTLEKVNLAQKVVIAQLHVKDNNSPPIKVFWNKGKITVGFRSDFNQATPVNSTVLAEVPLGARFDVSIVVNEDGACTVSANSNGRSGTTVAQLGSSWATQTLNFHGGVYNQVDYSDDTPAEDASVCVISALELSHE